MFHIKLKGIRNVETWSQIFCLLTAPPPDPGVVVKRSSQLFQNMVMLHIKLNEITKCSNMVADILTAAPPPLVPPPPPRF